MKIIKNVSKITENNCSPKLFIDGKEGFQAIFDLIDNARKSLYIEIFIFHNDQTGIKVADKIISKAREGIDVRVLIDSVGLMFKSGDSQIVNYLSENGVDVKVYNKYYISGSGVNITHRKILIADSCKAITGGMNFGIEYEKEWHDCLIEVRGEIVQEIQKEFFHDWKISGGEKIFPVEFDSKKLYGNSQMEITFTCGAPEHRINDFEVTFNEAIHNARDYIRIENSYFSDMEIINSLIEARKRGVKIEIILPEKNDLLIFAQLNLSTALILAENDIDVYFYQKAFLHTKAYIIDDIAIIGSANLDARSLRESQELNLIIWDRHFATELNSRLFNYDIYHSEKFELAKLKEKISGSTVGKTLDLLNYYISF